MSYWKEQITIGGKPFPRFIGGPLDGVFDSSFRILVRNFSKKNLLYTEMRHVGGIAHDDTGKQALDFNQSERPLSYQLAAHDCEFIDEACNKILAKGVDCVDLNVGCPARTVLKHGAGSALMGDLPRLETILKRLRKNISLPLTTKIRAGFKKENAIEVAQLVQDCGVNALAIHPRLQTQMSKGLPNYDLAARVKKTISIPVIFSGNIFTWDDAQYVYERTGVDGFLIGRGMWSKPWKLAELEAQAEGRPFTVDKKLIFTTALQHLDLMLIKYGDQGLHQFRKHLAWYIKSVDDASQIRHHAITSESVDEVRLILSSLMES